MRVVTPLLIAGLAVSPARTCDASSSPSSPPAAAAAQPNVPATAADAGGKPAPAAAPLPDAQAIAAVKKWTAAVAKGQADQAVATSGFPFALSDELSDCKDGELADGAALSRWAGCLAENKSLFGLKDPGPDLEASASLPDKPTFVVGIEWKVDHSAEDLVGHTYVSFVGADPEHPADVVYGLFSLESDPTSGAALIDGATLYYSLQGE